MGNFSSKYLKDIWNLPNILTMLRLVLIPVFAGLFLAGYEKWALAVFIIASITDYLDGYLARKNNQITAFGKLMDPLADKLMVCTALLGQGLSGVFPWPAILIVMTKEVVMIIGGIYMLQNGIVVYSNILGKAAQFSFIAALILSFWHKEFVAASLPLDRIILWIRGSGCIICAENCQRVQVAAVRLDEKVVRFRRGKVQFLTAKRSGQMQRLWQDFCAAQRRNGLRGQLRCVERNHDEAMRSAVRDRRVIDRKLRSVRKEAPIGGTRQPGGPCAV